MLAGIHAQKIWRSRSGSGPKSSSTNNEAAAEGTADARDAIAEIRDSEEADLASLNSSLTCLASIFPDVQPEVFREMLSTFSAESRLQLVTECLLKHKAKWVKGRWRVTTPRKPAADVQPVQSSSEHSSLPAKERFRSSDYKVAVKEALYQEFKNMSHSTIKAILAEHNFSYTDSRRALVALLSKSWRVSVTNLIFRRKLPSVDECPLTKWHQPVSGPAIPILIQTKSKELNEELERDLLAPLKARQLEKQLKEDAAVASRINEEEAESADALFECQCCFIPYAFESISLCDTDGHFICFRCIRNAMNEALFGQGWASSINKSKCSVNCIALSSGPSDSCAGCLPRDAVRRALVAESKGHEVWVKFEHRTAAELVTQGNLSLSSCPFCPYAEVNDPVPTSNRYAVLQELHRSLPMLSLCCLVFPVNPIVGVIILVLAVFHLRKRFEAKRKEGHGQRVEANILNGLNYGSKFICRNPTCQKSSCLNCLAPWVDIHICHQSARQALRTYIESAVTEAIKRTCPKCNLSFVKSSGCNKLVCVCGYSMCYVCRQDVGKEGYSHFCPHFRTNPGQACDECDRCDLYRTEDDDAVISKAKHNAIAAWREQRQGGDEAVDIGADLEGVDVSQEQQSPKQRKISWRFN